MKRLLTLASIAAAAFSLSNCATAPATKAACCTSGAGPAKACCTTQPACPPGCTKPCCATKKR